MVPPARCHVLVGSLALMLMLLLMIGLASPATTQAQVTSPEQFLGHKIGADHFLASYTQLSAYWKKLAAESPRLEIEKIGTTSYGQPMLMALISAPGNLAEREREKYRRISERLARARGLDDEEARKLAAEGRAVVWIDAGMHATESVAAQNILELVYQMVSRDDGETREILEQVILIVVPANPDGMEMVAKGYMATKKVGRLPVLYQRYVGHDNNRDFYMSSQPETTAINHVLYRSWHPQIVYNHHQTAPRGTILFTPPFRDPFNYEFDPIVVRGIELVSSHMNSRFVWEKKPGIISRSGARYSAWWNGGLRTTTYYHNMIGILTEAFGSPNPTKLTQTTSRRLPYGDYPDPVASGMWHARQTIDYLQTANRAILLLAARYRQNFLYNIYQMGRNSIRRGSQDHWTVTPRLVAEAKRRGKAADEAFKDPVLRDARSYILPADQPDRGTLRRFIQCLLKTGLDVHRAKEAFEFDGRSYKAGSFVIHAAQAFRPHLRSMFEPQWHPHDIGKDGEPIAPYDSAGWTLAMQMDIRFDRVYEALEGPFEAVSLEDLASPSQGKMTAGRAGYFLLPGDSSNYACINRLLAAGETLYCLTEATKVGQQSFPAGSIYIVKAAATKDRLLDMSRSLGSTFHGVARNASGPALALKRLRIGLFDTYGGSSATGWTQWALLQCEFPVELVTGARVQKGQLRDSYDVLIFTAGLPSTRERGRTRREAPGGTRRGQGQTPRRRRRSTPLSPEELEKMVEALPAFEDWSTAKERKVRLTKEKAVPALEEFLRTGGVVLAIGGQAESMVKLLKLPVKVGTYVTDQEGKEKRTARKEFYIPGSLVQIEVQPGHPIGYGVSPRLAAMFRRSPVFEVKDKKKVNVLASYSRQEILLSGWAVGEGHLKGKAAALEVPIGKGKLYLFGASVSYRGQPWGTLKLLFNAILCGSAREVKASRLR